MESAVGAHLTNAAATGIFDLSYWRDRGKEVDSVVSTRGALVAIEVKSGTRSAPTSGLTAFLDKYPDARAIVVGEQGIPVSEFLAGDPAEWLEN